jgi:outer membrane protein assembly factor BamB
LTATSSAALCADDDWRAWRGPNANGVAADGQSPPTSWSTKKNVVWKTPVPGRGHSSPIVVGDKVLLTSADERRQIQAVFCFDRKSGRQLWMATINQGGFPRRIHPKNTHASPTLASNGEQVFGTFCNHGKVQLVALDLKGKELWNKYVGPYRPRRFEYGYAPSPLLYKSTVIVASESDVDAYLAAFEQKSGREVWRTPRTKTITYSSPIVGNVAGRDQLLMSGGLKVASYDPANGRPLWSATGTAGATCGTAVWDGDLVFASGGYPQRETVAVKADGSKEVVWRVRDKSYEQSMLAHDGYLYAFNDQGVALCWRARDGKPMWRKRLAGPVSASPVLAGGNIYATNEKGTTWVFKASPNAYEEVAQNQLEEESFATPTICGNRIFLRVATISKEPRQETLYCLGE